MDKFHFSLEDIDISKIERNPENPRGKYVRDKDVNFDYLKRSIKTFGLLVPLVVQKLKNDKYRLIDGERRYNALRELGIKKAPAHVIQDVVPPNEVKNVMFHIHTTRLQWDAIEQCRALEPLYKELNQLHEEDENKVAKELVRLTGTNLRTVNARLNFLRWPDRQKSIAYNDQPDLYWTIVEIEQGIIKPALKNFPEYFEKVPVNNARKMLLEKYLKGKVRAATEARKIRNIVKTTPENTPKYKYAKQLLQNIIEDYTYTFHEAGDDFAAKYPEEGLDTITLEYLRKQSSKFLSTLQQYDPLIIKEMEEEKKESLHHLIIDITALLSQIDEDIVQST
ncbi:MAG: hypothetical protein A2W22_06875 [Candidatus Levybacteria bacterium RBG_16_35_11]|nr:MAG: hypothetical protein A2W22_06875 [Candidatus Levybacteria bacterium RBG_16_35_11]